MTSWPHIIWWASQVVLAFWFGLWFWSCKKLGRLGEWHHIYIGLAIALPPWYVWIGWWSLIPIALGQWIAEDDAILHDGQAQDWHKGDRPLTGADDGASFWHRVAHNIRWI